MTSTVLDAMVCLLFVSASVVAVTAAAPASGSSPLGGADESRSADAVADTLAASTATTNYTLSPPADDAFPVTDSPEFERTRHGTLLTHLAAAATWNLTVDGEPMTATGTDYRRAVRRHLRREFGRHRLRIDAVWSPYPNSSVEGRFGFGARPPPDATVHAATLTTASGYPATDARDVAAEGYAPLADAVAANVVDGTFPRRRTETALYGDYPTSALVAYRYRRAATLWNASVAPAVTDRDAGRANAELAGALSPRVERELRASTDSPRAAASRVETANVTVVVRTWS